MENSSNIWDAFPDFKEYTAEEKIYYWMGKFKDQQNDMRQLVSASIEALVAYERRFDTINGRYGPIDNEMDALRKILEGQ
jgi:hypothetical protein